MISKKKFLIYKAQRGDTLFSISRRFGVSVEELKRVNNKKSDYVKINEKFKIVKTRDISLSNLAKTNRELMMPKMLNPAVKSAKRVLPTGYKIRILS